jgi:hypothetical protein
VTDLSESERGAAIAPVAGGEQFAKCTAPAPPLSDSSARHTSVGSTPLARLRAPAAITLAFALALAAVAD